MGFPRRGWAAGLLTLLVLLSTACAVAGRAEPTCAAHPTQGPPTTPTGAPVITVDDRVSSWLQNGHTAPLGLAVYADGTAIRAGDVGSRGDSLPAMGIGRIDPCAVRAAVVALTGLAGDDFGMPDVTDQAVTTVTVKRPGSLAVVLSAYALGIGDEYVDRDQAAARAELSSAVDGLEHALTGVEPWTPTRLRITRLDRAAAGSTLRWPLTSPIAGVVTTRTDRRPACGVLDGQDAAAVIGALAAGPALSNWDDGAQRAILAIAVLVPGQAGCPA